MKIHYSSNEFERIGFEIIRKKPKSAKRKARMFKAWFGARPKVCACVFYKMQRYNMFKKAPARIVLPKHFFMGLHFLKNYDSEDRACCDFQCDQKTYRKWMWFIVECIAKLDKKIVRCEKNIYFFIYFFIYF